MRFSLLAELHIPFDQEQFFKSKCSFGSGNLFLTHAFGQNGKTIGLMALVPKSRPPGNVKNWLIVKDHGLLESRRSRLAAA